MRAYCAIRGDKGVRIRKEGRETFCTVSQFWLSAGRPGLGRDPGLGKASTLLFSPRQPEPMQSRRFQRETIGTARVHLGLIWHILCSMTTNIDEEVHCRSCCRLFLRSSLNLCRQGRVTTPREFKN